MHSIVVSFVAVVLSLLTLFSWELSDSAQIWWLALMVCCVGVPHGGLDHWAGRSLFLPFTKKFWLPLFLTCYLSVGILVAESWLVSPLATILVFFVLSAWHFGIEEDGRNRQKSMFDTLSRFAIGGMVIWIPAATQPEAVESIMSSLVSSDLRRQAIIACHVTAYSAWFLAPVFVWTWMIYVKEEPLVAIRLAAFAILFASVSPILSFLVYFCGWHSIRGLMQLRAMHSGSLTEFVTNILPLSLGAIALAFPIYLLDGQYDSLNQNLLRTTFVALSTIAIPHLLLHVVAGYCRARPTDGVCSQVGGVLE